MAQVFGTNSIIAILLVGLVAGWLAGKVVGGGMGLIGDIIVGIIGAFIGRWLFDHFHISIGISRWVDLIITAGVGAIILLFILRLFRR